MTGEAEGQGEEAEEPEEDRRPEHRWPRGNTEELVAEEAASVEQLPSGRFSSVVFTWAKIGMALMEKLMGKSSDRSDLISSGDSSDPSHLVQHCHHVQYPSGIAALHQHIGPSQQFRAKCLFPLPQQIPLGSPVDHPATDPFDQLPQQINELIPIPITLPIVMLIFAFRFLPLSIRHGVQKERELATGNCGAIATHRTGQKVKVDRVGMEMHREHSPWKGERSELGWPKDTLGSGKGQLAPVDRGIIISVSYPRDKPSP